MTTPTPKDGWLGRAIKAAEKEMKRWPKWMRDSAKFEGRSFGNGEDKP